LPVSASAIAAASLAGGTRLSSTDLDICQQFRVERDLEQLLQPKVCEAARGLPGDDLGLQRVALHLGAQEVEFGLASRFALSARLSKGAIRLVEAQLSDRQQAVAQGGIEERLCHVEHGPGLSGRHAEVGALGWAMAVASAP